MNEELNNLIDDILKEKLKLHYENEELEAQGKLIKELCKENKKLYSIIKEAREYIEDKYDYLLGDDTFLDNDERIDRKQIKHILEILDKVEENK